MIAFVLYLDYTDKPIVYIMIRKIMDRFFIKKT